MVVVSGNRMSKFIGLVFCLRQALAGREREHAEEEG
ncbi:unnamed protein product, partial [Linum tenue]